MKNFNRLQLISAAFCVIVIISNLISAKMVPLYRGFAIPAGLITYPLSFLLCNLVTEVYGKKAARQMIYITLGMNLLTFALIELAVALPSQTIEGQIAFQSILGSGALRIFSSLTAYFIAQIVDVQVYAFLKKVSPFLWLRNNGALLFSQLVDTVVIDILFLYLGLRMPMNEVVPIMLFSYLYKSAFSAINTPLLYLLCFFMKKEPLLEAEKGK